MLFLIAEAMGEHYLAFEMKKGALRKEWNSFLSLVCQQCMLHVSGKHAYLYNGADTDLADNIDE